MTFETISNFVAAFFTLSIFSFLYKDNPFYKFAESMFIGVSMGYAIPLVYNLTFIPFVYRPIFVEQNFWIVIPALMGSLYVFRFSKNLGISKTNLMKSIKRLLKATEGYNKKIDALKIKR